MPDAEDREVPPVLLRFRLPPLWNATRLCAAGFERADHIEHPCAMAVDEFEKIRLGALSRDQRRQVEACLDGLERIYRFTVSHDVADLYDGWLEIIPAASELQGTPLPAGWGPRPRKPRRGMVEFVHEADSVDVSEDD